ncbi:5843_t:CDS:2, partial [Racocetra persica]
MSRLFSLITTASTSVKQVKGKARLRLAFLGGLLVKITSEVEDNRSTSGHTCDSYQLGIETYGRR